VALNRYVVTATTTIGAGTPATVTAGEPGTGGYGNAAISAGAVLFPATFIKGTPVILDSASALYAALSGSLRPYVQGQDDRGGAALAN